MIQKNVVASTTVEVVCPACKQKTLSRDGKNGFCENPNCEAILHKSQVTHIWVAEGSKLAKGEHKQPA